MVIIKLATQFIVFKNINSIPDFFYSIHEKHNYNTRKQRCVGVLSLVSTQPDFRFVTCTQEKLQKKSAYRQFFEMSSKFHILFNKRVCLSIWQMCKYVDFDLEIDIIQTSVRNYYYACYKKLPIFYMFSRIFYIYCSYAQHVTDKVMNESNAFRTM